MKSSPSSQQIFRPGFRLQADIQAYDFHVHTNHSVCARHEPMTVPIIARRAQELGYKQLGISDHVYAESGAGPIQENGREIEALETPVQVFLGVELDFPEPGKPIIPMKDLLFTDYRFAAINHSYFAKRFTDLKNPEELRAATDYWCDLVEGVLEHPIDGIVHPMEPLQRYLDGESAFYFLYREKKQRLKRIFRNLAKKGVALELRSDLDWFQSAALASRDFYRAAIDAGVKLSPATDSHWLDRLGFQLLSGRIAYDINLRPEHIWHPSVAPRNKPVKGGAGRRSSRSKVAGKLPKRPKAAK